MDSEQLKLNENYAKRIDQLKIEISQIHETVSVLSSKSQVTDQTLIKLSSIIHQELKDLSDHNRIKALEKRVSSIAQEWNAKNNKFQKSI